MCIPAIYSLKCRWDNDPLPPPFYTLLSRQATHNKLAGRRCAFWGLIEIEYMHIEIASGGGVCMCVLNDCVLVLMLYIALYIVDVFILFY